MANLTVLQILPALDSGGVERATLEVAGELVRQGHRSLVISAGGSMVEALERGGTRHVAWPIGRKSLSTLRLVARLRRLLHDEQVDIVHARSRLPAWIAYLAWRGMDPASRPRFVTTVHGFYSVGRYSAVMTRGERVIAASESIRDYVTASYPRVDAGNIVVIPPGVDRRVYSYGYRPGPSWQDRWSQEFPQLSGRYLVTLPGRVTRMKGHEDLVDIIGLLLDRGLPVHGMVVGGARKRRRRFLDGLEDKIRGMGLEERITFTGPRGDLREILAVSDVVLSLSRYPEAFGRTTLEALSLGRPVCGYDHGGVAKQLAIVFPEGRVPVGDWRAAAGRIAEWYRSPPSVAAEHPFTLERMLSDVIDVYQELAAGRTASPAIL
ncbi:MAG: glycosyltransferase family 4 protein [Gammaproteobacteria bacterium]|nr:glycosyltransferase family 4 protein [Gammaproteobacteria bacterium]NIR28878.1 glycosyltransferase family 4 protein [Gammaproteobacteria bacterium]NIR97274.1 glycosyltransferase family 4 protein [Gammaproteobacteria bacterium]NIT62974.1 glycosyltransferase family 4 protein [Gammaproteobacteria bacterium]NIV19933.1 glycosyltransferase [Gammaproteobacteria bacterium]